MFEPLESLLRKEFYKGALSEQEEEKKNDLINRYWEIQCPRGYPCRPNTCSFSKPIDWLGYRGYTSLKDCLNKMRSGKKAKHLDAFKADWARQQGHYNG